MKIPLVDLKVQHDSIREELDATIRRVIDSSKFVGGEELESFEREFATYCGKKHAVAVSSGTAALHLALLSHNLDGKEVITTPNTFTATAATIHHAGGKIKFVDVDEYHLIDTQQIVPTSNTKAIIPVHLYGQVADMDPILELASEKDLMVIEDAAQAHGAEYKEKKVPISETGIFSFFPAKPLGALGDGGAVVTDNEELARKVKQLRDHGRSDRVREKYEHSFIGLNYRLDALKAATLRIKLRHLDNWNNMRRKNAVLYNKLLAEIPEIETPEERDGNKHVYYVYTIRVKNRDKLAEFLNENGISTQIYYPIPLHLQKAYSFLGYKRGDFPVAEKCADGVISLPMYPELKEEQINYVCEKINEIFKKIK